ncbi:hypothetical protein E2C01_050223 [Portunus trituberculatus]|uniref:Uncharacterized protein n=1 Tax=Portunus trituberculatus TaxID=210409 RepID=A0A5B7G7P1_PORTR|nr:hypothetical protein [Portunus trituberculatus]
MKGGLQMRNTLQEEKEEEREEKAKIKYCEQWRQWPRFMPPPPANRLRQEDTSEAREAAALLLTKSGTQSCGEEL